MQKTIYAPTFQPGHEKGMEQFHPAMPFQEGALPDLERSFDALPGNSAAQKERNLVDFKMHFETSGDAIARAAIEASQGDAVDHSQAGDETVNSVALAGSEDHKSSILFASLRNSRLGKAVTTLSVFAAGIAEVGSGAAAYAQQSPAEQSAAPKKGILELIADKQQEARQTASDRGLIYTAYDSDSIGFDIEDSTNAAAAPDPRGFSAKINGRSVTVTYKENLSDAHIGLGDVKDPATGDMRTARLVANPDGLLVDQRAKVSLWQKVGRKWHRITKTSVLTFDRATGTISRVTMDNEQFKPHVTNSLPGKLHSNVSLTSRLLKSRKIEARVSPSCTVEPEAKRYAPNACHGLARKPIRIPITKKKFTKALS